jgi:hypothetical protein
MLKSRLFGFRLLRLLLLWHQFNLRQSSTLLCLMGKLFFTEISISGRSQGQRAAILLQQGRVCGNHKCAATKRFSV